MIRTEGDRSTWKNPVTVPLYLPQIETSTARGFRGNIPATNRPRSDRWRNLGNTGGSGANRPWVLGSLYSPLRNTGKIGLNQPSIYTRPIRDTKPTKCTNFFLIYLHHNITLNTATRFDPQGNVIRESNQSNAAKTK